MNTNKNAQSLIEVILALGVFAAIVATVTTMITGSYSLLEQSNEYLQAKGYVQVGIEVARAAHANSWNALAYTSSTTDVLGKFTRTTEYSAVCRDSLHSIAACPATYTDVQSKLATVTVQWQVRPGTTDSVRQSMYLTNWNSHDWLQTDWSGGPGQTTWSDATRYDSSSSLDATSTPGSIALGEAADGQWSLSGGGIFIDTNDADFNQGTFSSTAVQGTGESARIDLSQAIQWVIHQDSASSTTRDINALSVLGSSDVWAAVDNGEILRYNGSQWSLHTDVGSAHLKGISMRTSNEGWAVGQTGKIYRYNGSVWSENTDTGDHVWRDVTAITANDVWVVGNDSDDEDEGDGYVGHYDGSSWAVIQPPSNSSVRAIYAVTATDVWAAGKNGRIWHYDGSAWSLFTDTGDEKWNDLVMLSATDGWAVGNDGALAHWNGSSWTESTISSSANIRGVFAVSPSDIWATGNSGRIWRYNGSSWLLYTDLGDQTWRAIAMVSSGEGWVGGSGGKIGAYGLYYDASGTFTSRVFDSGSTGTTWSIATWVENLPSESDATLATRTGNTATPDGTWSSWSSELTNSFGSTITSPSSRRYAQYRLTLTRGLVPSASPRVNSATVIYNLATSQNLRGIAFVSASDMWAVGASGKIVQFNGSQWYEFTDTGGETWNDIVMQSSSDGWVAGEGGSLAHWNGTSWTESSIPSSADIKALYGFSQSDIWAVGSNGRIWRYNGSSWSLHTDTGDETWNDVVFSSANDGWVMGSSGSLSRWLGSSWVTAVSPTSQTLEASGFINRKLGYAVGVGGTVMQFYRESLFATSGSLTSSIFSLSDDSPVQAIEWQNTATDCVSPCALRFQVRTAPDSGGSPGTWNAWGGANGADTYFTNERGTLVPTFYSGNRYVQYRADFIGDGSSTSILSDVRINYR